MPPLTDIELRFFRKMRLNPETECWEWTGAISHDGYGKLGLRGKRAGWQYAHRIAYRLFVGPIPENLDIDHLCRVRHCVNPQHLEAVTRRENLLRGTGRTARNYWTTHCHRGHRLAGDNLYIRPDGKPERGCRECRSLASRSPGNRKESGQ